MGAAIYYVPHADDEILTYGVSIKNHLNAGREVVVVLYTKGWGSKVQNELNGTAYSPYWGATHNPTKEGYETLDNDEFGDARKREFINSCYALGVNPSNVYFRPLTVTNSITEMKNVILEFNTLFPAASHKAMSWKDRMGLATDDPNEHSVSGYALKQLWQAGTITDARFYISRYNIMNGTITGGSNELLANSSHLPDLRHSTRCYDAWAPMQGLFAIGYHSVKDQFDNFLADVRSRYHLPTA